jgi:hypothetical protein
MNYCFLNGLFSGVPQKYDKLGSLIVVHDLPGLVAQNGNGQVSVVAVRFFFSFAPACGTAPTKKKFAATPTVNALINFDFIVSSSSFCACRSRDLLRVRSQRPRNRHASNKVDELAPPQLRPLTHCIVAAQKTLVKGRPMSALGHKRTYAVQKGMSASPPKADMCGALAHVRFGPKADIDSRLGRLRGTQHCVAKSP